MLFHRFANNYIIGGTTVWYLRAEEWFALWLCNDFREILVSGGGRRGEGGSIKAPDTRRLYAC